MKAGILAALVIVLGGVLAGCDSIGNAPTGPDQAQVKRNFDALPVDQKIQFLENSPIPKAQKEKQIAELKAQQGK